MTSTIDPLQAESPVCVLKKEWDPFLMRCSCDVLHYLHHVIVVCTADDRSHKESVLGMICYLLTPFLLLLGA